MTVKPKETEMEDIDRLTPLRVVARNTVDAIRLNVDLGITPARHLRELDLLLLKLDGELGEVTECEGSQE